MPLAPVPFFQPALVYLLHVPLTDTCEPPEYSLACVPSTKVSQLPQLQPLTLPHLVAQTVPQALTQAPLPLHSLPLPQKVPFERLLVLQLPELQ